MGRIRTVKPEWLEDELMAYASSDARVLSIALILLADDYGNGRCTKQQLAGRVYPQREDSDESLARASRMFRESLAELSRIRFIGLYEIDGQHYFAIRNWDKHQKVDHPGKPLVPGPPEGFWTVSRNPRESLAPDRDLEKDLEKDLIRPVCVRDPDCERPQPTTLRLDRPGQNSDTLTPPQNRTERRPQTSQATTPAAPPSETRPEAITEQELKRRCREEPTRDLHSRAAQCIANPYDGLFERPEMWPEVQAMAYAFSCVYGARYRHLGKIPQHKGLMALLAILGAGVTHTDYMRAVNLSMSDEWFAKLKGPSLTTLSLDVVLRLLAEAEEKGAA